MDKAELLKKVWPQWEIVRELGEGAFGSVYEVERKDIGGTFKAALKFMSIPKSQKEIQDAMTEGMDETTATTYFRSIMEDLVKEFATMEMLKGNTNIVSYEDHVVVEHENEVGWDILIRMELLTPFKDHLQSHPMSEKDVIKVGRDICSALVICEKRNIVHRDIKMENVFVSEYGDYKLGDFGVARTVEKTTSGMSIKGTISYMAPEVYKGQQYNSSVDMYSLGILLYRLVNNNRSPFLPPAPAPISYTDKENAEMRRLAGERFPDASSATPELMAIIRKATAYKAAERYASAADMRDDLARWALGKTPVAMEEEQKNAQAQAASAPQTAAQAAVTAAATTATAAAAAAVNVTNSAVQQVQVQQVQARAQQPNPAMQQVQPERSGVYPQQPNPAMQQVQPERSGVYPQQPNPAMQQVQPERSGVYQQPNPAMQQVPPENSGVYPQPGPAMQQPQMQAGQYVQPVAPAAGQQPKKKKNLGLILGLAIGIPVLLLVLGLVGCIACVNALDNSVSQNNSNSHRNDDDDDDKPNNDDPDEPNDPDEPDPNNNGSTDPGNNDPGNNDPGNNDPGNNDPGNNDPGNNDPGYVDPGYSVEGAYTASIAFNTLYGEKKYEYADTYTYYDSNFDLIENAELYAYDAEITGDGRYTISIYGMDASTDCFYDFYIATNIPLADYPNLTFKLDSIKINGEDVEYQDYWYWNSEEYLRIVLEDATDADRGGGAYSQLEVSYPNLTPTWERVSSIYISFTIGGLSE